VNRSAGKLLLRVDVFMYGRCCYKLSGCKATVMYLFVDFTWCRGKATYPRAIFGSCHDEERLGKQRLKGLRGIRWKGVVEADCPLNQEIYPRRQWTVIYSTLTDSSSRIRAHSGDFSSFWCNEAANAVVHYVTACKIPQRCDSPTFERNVYPLMFIEHNRKIHGDRPHCKLCNRSLIAKLITCTIQHWCTLKAAKHRIM